MTATAKTVVQALSAVMGDVQAVGKDGRNTQQNYNFRGVDAVVNAVGPALRKHGVVVVPVAVTYDDERYQTAKGSQMRGITATVTFRFYGPAGDFIEAQAAGESSDAGDKAMPKAHSVAYRTLLLQALCIPTDDPEPDAASHERAKQEPQPARRSSGNGAISEPQRKRLWAIARERGLDRDTVATIVQNEAGVDSTGAIPREKYDAVIEALETVEAA